MSETTVPTASAPVENIHAEMTQEELERRLQINVVDISHGVTAGAQDHAAEYINRQTTEGKNFLTRFVKKVWHGNLARDYYKIREEQRGVKQIVESGNVHVLQDGSEAEHDRTVAAVVDRVANDYLHGGETKQDLSELEQGAELEASLKELVKGYAEGSVAADALIEGRTRLLDQFGKHQSAEDRRKGLLFADNIIEVAQNAKLAVEHGLGLDRIDAALGTSHTAAAMGARTEVKLNKAEKWVTDKVYSSKLGSLVNETTLAVAASIPLIAAKFTTRKVAVAAGAVLGLGVGAGVVAGFREGIHVKQDRQTHMREMATGGGEALSNKGKRREEMEATRYETTPAEVVITNLQSAIESARDGEDGLRDALDHLTHSRVLVSMSDEKSADFIQYSSRTDVEAERLDIDIKIAEARATVQEALNEVDDATLVALGIDGMRDVGEVLDQRSIAVVEQINGDISARDQAFRKLQRARVAKAGVIGFATAVTVGLVSQELMAAASDTVQGVFEGNNADQARRTLLAGIFHGAAEHASAPDSDAATTLIDTPHHGSVEVPAGYGLSKEDGKWLLTDSNNNVVEHVTFDEHGQLSDASKDALQGHGFSFDVDKEHIVDTKTTHEMVTRTPQEYINKHPDKFTHVNRELWYDNDTPSDYDQNELGLWWGGQEGTGIDQNGNYVFSVAHMNPDGSFNGDLSADYQQLIREGKMSMALSMSDGTQDHVIMVHINEQGQAVINKDSFAGKSLFDSRDGHAHYTGAYAEAVQLGGTHHGTQSVRMLATVVGEHNVHNVQDNVSHVIKDAHNEFTTKLIPPVPETSGLPVEVPFAVPIRARGGLEYADTEESESYPYAGYVGSYTNEYINTTPLDVLERQRLAPHAAELASDPDAELDANKVVDSYWRSLRPRYRRTLKQLSGQLERQPKAAAPKVAVLIPAAAHQEGKNIYNTLEQYLNQEDVPRDQFEIVVFANSPLGAKRDKTIKEVKRFQKEHPDMPIRLVEHRLEKEEANIGWIRKAITDAMVDDYRSRGVDLNSVMFVSNDADSNWIHPKYLRTVIDKSEAQPDVDGFLGFIDWGYDAYKAHPEMLASTRFMQMLEVYLRVNKKQIGSSGANFAFRPGMYMAVGGYQSNTELGEDVMLGRMIKSVRAGATTRRPIAFMGRSSEVNTSARRALDKLLKDGGAPAQQWEDGFGTDDDLRTKEFDTTPFNYNDPDAVRSMIESTERMLNKTLDMYRGSFETTDLPGYREGRLTALSNESVRQINRMFMFIGVTVDWQPDGSIKVIEAEAMIAGLKNWRTKH